MSLERGTQNTARRQESKTGRKYRRTGVGNKLIKSLRMRLGNAFLQGVHTVCAHPVKTNLFVKTNRYNHLPNTYPTSTTRPGRASALQS